MTIWQYTVATLVTRNLGDRIAIQARVFALHGYTQRFFATAPSQRTRPASSPKEELKDEEYQYLPRSSLPTYYFQRSLPRLPIPKLELTCQRYLECVKNILTPEEFRTTKNVVEEFQSSAGPELHEKLLDFDKSISDSSYISAAWFDMYLRDRKPLPINYNPALVFVEDGVIDKLPESQRQLIRATNFLVSALRFMRSLDSETLAPEVYHMNPKKTDTQSYRNVMKMLPTAFATYGSYLYKAFPLDMSQYNNLFRSTRIPAKDIDCIKLASRNVRHIVVQRRGHFYKCNVLDTNGQILPVNELLGNLEYILDENSEEAKYPLGVMTSQNRDIWADVRSYMISKSAENKKSLSEIDSALFVLCLDDVKLGNDPVPVTRSFLHSDACNRWFDKSFQMIVSKDAWAGVTFEHAWGDGVAVLRFFNEIHQDTKLHQWSNTTEVCRPTSPPTKLDFDFDERIQKAIEQAKLKHKNVSERLQIHPFIFEKFGKQECKTWSISPDSVMQLGFQIAYFRMYNETPPTYESCSTAAFKHGRTEAIRPATDLTKTVAQIMSGKDWTSKKGELKELIRKCSEKHNSLTKDAAMGQGFDRHLFALRKFVNKDSEHPQIFRDTAYERINYNQLSTSTLASPAVRIGAFGPVVEDGYGLGYQIWEGGLGCVTATYEGGKDGPGWVDTCHKVFDDIKTVMSS